MSGSNQSRHVSPAAVNLRSEHDETLVFESRFESANLAKVVQVYVLPLFLFFYLLIFLITGIYLYHQVVFYSGSHLRNYSMTL